MRFIPPGSKKTPEPISRVKNDQRGRCMNAQVFSFHLILQSFAKFPDNTKFRSTVKEQLQNQLHQTHGNM